ncbi:hypothetical protein MTAT_20020 [Moorella thermoacetica]|uniref:Uncharacterized protein n=1 Tax=Neomoorella thermoacetica TaxID=1525 RepID=A0AAC9HIA6_NEOTH|nr:hypothetical protein [Moorella thermoacetica]AOQ24657.1 hypothetical protein Maut_02229 [Moorella thermoacetica]TYL12760.1 hypothetical protein MTAT_20020 [Moorella thermoacetica]
MYFIVALDTLDLEKAQPRVSDVVDNYKQAVNNVVNKYGHDESPYDYFLIIELMEGILYPDVIVKAFFKFDRETGKYILAGDTPEESVKLYLAAG